MAIRVAIGAGPVRLFRQSVTEIGSIARGRHDILTGSNRDGTLAAGAHDTTCNNWTSNGAGKASVGHHDKAGCGEFHDSWNSAHLSDGCSQAQLRATGGDGLFYCFAVR